MAADGFASEITFHKKLGGAASKTNEREQMRKNNLEAQDKFAAGINHKVGPTNAKKLDEDTGSYKHTEVSTDFKKALMQARSAKGLTQKQLAQMINQPPAVIQTYENGKAVPQGDVIAKLNRALGITLPKVAKPKKAKD